MSYKEVVEVSTQALKFADVMVAVPVFNKGDPGLQLLAAKRREDRRGSVAAAVLGRQSCKIS